MRFTVNSTFPPASISLLTGFTVLQLITLEDLSDKIEWLSKNCQGAILLLSEPEMLLQFGNINRFEWAYRAKVVIVGLSLESLETFLNTTKGKKTENIIGVVEDPVNHHFKLYMNLLFWGEGMQPVTDWWGTRFTRKANLFPDKVSNLRLGKVRVFVFEWRPIMFYERDEKGNVIGKYGRDLTIVRTLAKLFNYTLVFVDIEQDWGLPLPNGSFTGLVGYLGRDEGQMGLAYLYSSGLDDRHRVQDYSRPIEDDKGCFLTRVEAPMPPWQNPSLPFQTTTWLAFFIGLVLSGPIFYLIVAASRGEGQEYSQYRSLLSTILLTTGIHFSHPVVSLPKHRSSQIFIIFLLIYILVLSTGYRSNLTSFLTIARTPKRLETFKDMYESGLQVKSISWFYNALNHSGNPYLQKLLDRYEIRLTFEELIDEFMAGRTATINSKAYLEVLSTLMRTKKGKPLVRFLSECLSTYSVGIGFQWHTPLKPKFNKAIARLVESGIVRRWFLQANEQYRLLVEKEGGVSYYPDTWYDSKDGVIPLGLNHMQGIFAVFALGYVFATISFAIEVITCRR
ncbi:probable glutamate receptor [Palaemon carinicauda]|uniref:probable glutamate receptor n=1 Tax=Palaemon carinicauda TaxID=392227 RepID=UPI0035B690B1